MFEDLLRQNLSYINETPTLFPIFPSREVKLKIKIEESTYFICCNPKGVFLESEFEQYDCYFDCSKESFADLLLKKVHLQKLLKINGTIYQGSFRNLLFLESLFSFFSMIKKS